MAKEWAVIAAILLSALAVVGVRNNDRNLFARWSAIEARNEHLNIQWSQLLLEQGAYAAHARVGQIARQQLQMSMPSSSQVITIYTGGASDAAVRK